MSRRRRALMFCVGDAVQLEAPAGSARRRDHPLSLWRSRAPSANLRRSSPPSRICLILPAPSLCALNAEGCAH
eukprot:6582892-Pyramimonas_sp.AAC.1